MTECLSEQFDSDAGAMASPVGSEERPEAWYEEQIEAESAETTSNPNMHAFLKNQKKNNNQMRCPRTFSGHRP